VALRPRNPQALDAFLHNLYVSPLTHARRYLSPQEFAARFAPTQAERASVAEWLSKHGLRVTGETANGLAVRGVGSAARLQATFRTHLFRYSIQRVQFMANAGPLHLPRSMNGIVRGVIGLDTLSEQAPRPALTRSVAPQRDGPDTGFWPSDLAQMYHLDPLWRRGSTGVGQSVAIVEASDYKDGDIAAFDSQFGIHGQVDAIPVEDDSGSSAVLDDGASEAEGDIEIVQAAAPDAHILVYESANDSDGTINTWEQIVSDDRASVISNSWGLPETSMDGDDEASLNDVFKEAAAQGQSILTSSGDRGAYDNKDDDQNPDQDALSVEFPAADPWVTGVGGTTLEQAADGSYGGETAWSDTSDPRQEFGGGGGLSGTFAQPSYQQGPGVANSYSNGQRQVPDVAANAGGEIGYAVYARDDDGTDRWIGFGGTSGAAPYWAGFIAVANQDLGHPLGFLNPTLYTMGQSLSSFSVPPFHDITSGSNLYYPATPGWDYATGWGSFDATALVDDLEGRIEPTPTPGPTNTPLPTPRPRPTLTPTVRPTSTPSVRVTSTPTPKPATNPSSKSRSVAIPVSADVLSQSVRIGTRQQVFVKTAGGVQVALTVVYAGGRGASFSGAANTQGQWQSSWIVTQATPGAASAKLLLRHGSSHRNFTLHFTVTR
jgi:subtilase family serine protease